MTDNRERAIAEVAEEIGWTTEQVSYCTYSVMCMAVNQCEAKLDLQYLVNRLINAKYLLDTGAIDSEDFQKFAKETALDAVAKAERKG